MAPPRSVEMQTDPSDKNCSCESMNQKIKELQRTVAIKEAVINTKNLEMRNHPLIGENNDLKRVRVVWVCGGEKKCLLSIGLYPLIFTGFA